MITPDTADLDYMFELAGEEILINETHSTGILTNANFLNKNDERYVHTLDKIKLGDIITYQDGNYIVMTETTTKRYGKYKAIIRHCNYVIEFKGETEEVLIGHDDYGRPVYDYIEGEPYLIPSIIDNKSFAVSGSQILVAENEVIVTMQDNQLNREKFAVNEEFELMDVTWKVRNQDKTRKGLLILTCERVL